MGRKPIPLPEGVEVKIEGNRITVKGPLGELSRELRPEVEVVKEDGQLIVRRTGETRVHKAMHGLFRSLIANMVEGVSKGFVKELEMRGVGYRADLKGRTLILEVGYSHPVNIEVPEGMEVEVEKFTPTAENEYLAAKIRIKGIDKEALGNFAARIRAVRKPEPYKGKGIRYAGEEVRRKPGKGAKAVGG